MSMENRNVISRLVRKHGLDRRRRYSEWLGILVMDNKVTVPCTGCSCADEYPCSCCTKRGPGCRECGGKGKCVLHFPEPVLVNGEAITIPRKDKNHGH
jgi:hypothetical protein